MVLEFLRIEEHIPSNFRLQGRPQSDRIAIARAFIAKAVYDMPTSRILLDRLASDGVIRRICGWEKITDMPSEATFSRAFAELSASQLPKKVHETLNKKNYEQQLVGHISRDSTEIEAREKPVKKVEMVKEKRKRGRPKKGQEVIKEPTRLERQEKMSLEEMLKDLPKNCDVGSKKNSKGYKETWIGYKLHIDTADGQIPVSCVLTSASTHDSQAAIPLAELTNEKLTNLYDLMDSAYDASAVKKKSFDLGHVPIIDVNPRRNKALKEEGKPRVPLNLRHCKLKNLLPSFGYCHDKKENLRGCQHLRRYENHDRTAL